MENKNIATSIAFFILGFIVCYFIFGNSNIPESNLSVGGQKIEDSSDILAYFYLLDSDNYSRLMEMSSKIEEKKDLDNLVLGVYINYVFSQDPALEKSLNAVMKEVSTKKQNISYFDKDTSCAALTSNIKNGLKSNEDLETIFYSPTLDSCLYVITQSNEGSSYNNYVSEVYKKIYKSTSNSAIESYKVYSSDRYKNDISEKESDSGARNLVRYILENSNYNVDVLQNISYLNLSM